MKIYKTIIRPVVTYASETWTVTTKDENNLRIFERQILRKIFGPVNIDSVWRKRNNMEIDKLTLRSLTLYIYGAPILDVSRSHTTTQHSR